MSSPTPLNSIRFPDHVPPARQRSQVPPALKFITSLLYRSGTGLSLVYVLLLLVIQPLLEVQYERRGEWLKFTLQKCRTLLKFLGAQHPRLPTVAVKRGDKLYSDAAVQTMSDEETKPAHKSVYFADEPPKDPETNPVRSKLEKLHDVVEHYNKYCCSIKELHPFSFQVKKLQGRIDAYSHAQLFCGPKRTMAGKSAGLEIRDEIRSIKGLYLTGQV